jgi:pimeloyl-ACP methyl ester carboxylesterase
MSMVATKDGTEIYYKDWGSKDAQPIVFHHGWPLSGDAWDTQLLYFIFSARAPPLTGSSLILHRRYAQELTGCGTS